MEDLIGAQEAAKEYGLGGLQLNQLKFLLRGKQVGNYRGRRLYRRADIEAIIATIEAQRPPSNAFDVWPCPGCGRPLPKQWLLDRCHECMEDAA